MHIFFAPGELAPGTARGERLLAHELTHVAQQQRGASIALQSSSPVHERDAHEHEADRVAEQLMAGLPAGHITPRGGGAAPQCQTLVDVDVLGPRLGPRLEYEMPVIRVVHRVGSAAGPNVLMQIEDLPGGRTEFRWFNFATAEARTGTPEEWHEFRRLASAFALDPAFMVVASQLTPAQWQSMWPDPLPALMRLHDERRVEVPDAAVRTLYGGMIDREARTSLQRNEDTIDQLLNAPDRVRRLEIYAQELHEVSVLRDIMESERSRLQRLLPVQHAPSIGYAGVRGATDLGRQIDVHRRLAPIDGALRSWYEMFPLLSRLRTDEIRAGQVQATLLRIKSNIIVARRDLEGARAGRGPFDLWDLDAVRGQLTDLGVRVTEVVEREDRRRHRAEVIRGGALAAATIGLLLLPGGLFLDAALGVALTAHSWQNAGEVGRLANTGVHVDGGLMGQAHATSANVEAVFSTVLMVVGSGVAGFRVLRIARRMLDVRRVAPELGTAAQVRVARVLVDNPSLFRD